MLNKKGVDAVVATVLIIMITVAAVAIIWMFIIPTVKDSLSESTSEKAALSIETDGGYTTWDEFQQIARVQVKRGNDKVNLTGIDFNFIKGGNTKKNQTNEVPAPGLTKVYEFNLSGFGKPDKINLAPITKKGVGNVVSESKTINESSGGGSDSAIINYLFISLSSIETTPDLNNTKWYDSGSDVNGDNIYYDESNTYAYWRRGVNWLISNISEINKSPNNYFKTNKYPENITVIGTSTGADGIYLFQGFEGVYDSPIWKKGENYSIFIDFSMVYLWVLQDLTIEEKWQGPTQYYLVIDENFNFLSPNIGEDSGAVPDKTDWSEGWYYQTSPPTFEYDLLEGLFANGSWSGSINMTGS